MNSIIFLLKNDFSSLSFEDKVKIKELGRPIPYLDIKKREKSKNEEFCRTLFTKKRRMDFLYKKKSL